MEEHPELDKGLDSKEIFVDLAGQALVEKKDCAQKN